MIDNEIQQRLLAIFNHAKTAKLIEFRFLRDWEDYRFYNEKRKAYKDLVKVLNNSSKRLFKTYCKEVSSGEGNFTQLVAYQQIYEVISFYKQELKIITDMVYEYEAYLMDGHFMAAFLGEYRSDENLRDFRE